MSNSNFTRINPKDTNGRIMIGPDSRFILEKSADNYNLLIELPCGKTEKLIFKSNTEYILTFNKESKNDNDTRILIGNTNHIVNELA